MELDSSARTPMGFPSASGRLLGILFVAVFLVDALPSNAQNARDTLEVVKVGVLYLKSDLGATSVMVDSSALGTATTSHQVTPRHTHSAAVVGELTRISGVKLGSISSARQCTTRLPSGCRLADTDAVIEFSPPVFTGSTATMVVHSFFRSLSARQPVAAKDVVISFARAGDRWEITKVTILRES